MPAFEKQGLQIQSTFTSAGQVELRLVAVETASPKDDGVIVRMEACPINPSDLRVMFGSANMETVKVTGPTHDPLVTADLSAGALQLSTAPARIDQASPTGNEGAGVVVATGASEQARSLLGKTVAFIGQPSYTQYRCIPAQQFREALGIFQ